MSTASVTPLDVRLMNTTAMLLFMVFIVLCVTFGMRWLGARSVFALRGISIVGDVAHNNALTLRANVAPRMAGTFFTVDLGQVRQAFESVPWVRKAVVRREFPNRLRVQLQEHRAEAFWGTEGEMRLINTYGEVFDANPGEVDQETLPRLNGPDGLGPDVLAMYRAIEPMFEAVDMDIDSLELSRGGSWSVHLDSGAHIELGRGSVDEVSARLQRFLKTVTQVLSRFARPAAAIESADLRHENGYALKLAGITTIAAPVSKK